MSKVSEIQRASAGACICAHLQRTPLFGGHTGVVAAPTGTAIATSRESHVGSDCMRQGLWRMLVRTYDVSFRCSGCSALQPTRLEREGDLHAYGVAVGLRAASANRHRQQYASIFATPDAGAPLISVHDGQYRCAAPRSRDGRCEALRYGGKMPSAFSRVAK